MKNKKEKNPCVYGNARVQSLGNAVLQIPEVPGMIVLSKYNSFQEQKKPYIAQTPSKRKEFIKHDKD